MEETELIEGQAAPTNQEQQASQARDTSDAELLQGMLAQADGPTALDATALAAEAQGETAPQGNLEEAVEPAQKALEDARAVLARAKIHKDIINGLAPDALLEQAETLKGVQAEQDREGNWRDQLVKRLEHLEGGSTEGSDDTEEGGSDAAQPSDGQKARTPDLSEALQPVDEYLYEGIPEALTATATAMAGYTEERIAEATAPLMAQVQELTQELVRRELVGEYPQLRDATAYGKVKQAMAEIQPRVQVEGGSAFDQVYAVMGRASQIELGTGGAPSESPPQNGGLVPPTRKPSSENAMSADERSAAYLKAAMASGSSAAGRRAAGL